MDGLPGFHLAIARMVLHFNGPGTGAQVRTSFEPHFT
jgi:hypothetical protein